MLFANIQIKVTIVAPLLWAQLLIGQAYHSYLVIGTQFHKMWAIYGHRELGFKNLVLHCVTDSCNHGFNLGLVLVCWKYYNAISCSVLPASSFWGRKIHELNLVSSGRHWYWLGRGRSKDLYRIFYKYWWSFFQIKYLCINMPVQDFTKFQIIWGDRLLQTGAMDP